jgi:glycosyltransferase involved in cell wall biosynthesis
MSRPLDTIAVDLTPLLPGAENGGAKIFVLELLRGLAERAPATKFVLLTQAGSHDELAVLDRPNVRRLMVLGSMKVSTVRPFTKNLAARILPRIPRALRLALSRFAYDVNAFTKRGIAPSLLRSIGVDLLFCPFTAPIYFEPGVPTVCTIYDLQYKTFPDFFTPEEVSLRSKNFTEACRRSAAMAAISDYSRESAILHGQLDSKRIRTIHLRMANRVDVAHDADPRILDRLGLVRRRYLIYPANFWMHKNHEMLLTGFGIACNEGLDPDIRLVCTGASGARLDWLSEAATRMGLGDRIVFPGFVPHADLAALLGNAGAMVFPSLYEGFGLPVIEAMSAGVPVACSNTTSLPEVAAGAAVFFDPRIPLQIAQAMVSLMGSETLQEELRAAGRIRAAEFADTSRMVAEYWTLFEYAVSNDRRENAMTGVHVDGWAGPLVEVQVAASSAPQTLTIELSAPEWHPVPGITIRARSHGTPAGADIKVARGSGATWSVPVEAGGGHFDLRIYPSFVPARIGMGDDLRELSLMITSSVITQADGRQVDLLAAQATA